MPTQRKIFTVANLAQKLKLAKVLILADYSGLNVSQINELRREIKKVGGEFEVVKNTLLRLAGKNARLPDGQGKWKRPLCGIPSEWENGKLIGPTAALWIYQDDLTPLKTLDNFIKKTALPKISGACSFRIKCGFWEGKQITLERIKELASLPGLSELQAGLVSILQSPTFGLVNALSWNLRKLILVLKAKGGEN